MTLGWFVSLTLVGLASLFLYDLIRRRTDTRRTPLSEVVHAKVLPPGQKPFELSQVHPGSSIIEYKENDQHHGLVIWCTKNALEEHPSFRQWLRRVASEFHIFDGGDPRYAARLISLPIDVASSTGTVRLIPAPAHFARLEELTSALFTMYLALGMQEVHPGALSKIARNTVLLLARSGALGVVPEHEIDTYVACCKEKADACL